MRTITATQEDYRLFENWKHSLVRLSLEYEREQIEKNNVRGWRGFKAQFTNYEVSKSGWLNGRGRVLRDERMDFLEKLKAHIIKKEPLIKEKAQTERDRAMKCYRFSWLNLVPNVIRKRF